MMVYSMSFTCCPLCLSSVLNSLNEHLLLQFPSPSVGVWVLSCASVLLLGPLIQAILTPSPLEIQQGQWVSVQHSLPPFFSAPRSSCPGLFGSSCAGPQMCRRFSVLTYTVPLALAPYWSPCWAMDFRSGLPQTSSFLTVSCPVYQKSTSQNTDLVSPVTQKSSACLPPSHSLVHSFIPTGKTAYLLPYPALWQVLGTQQGRAKALRARSPPALLSFML